MKIILSGIEQPLLQAWRAACGSLPDVSIVQGSILDLEIDAIVSPANSFGFMDGGIDGLYRMFFGDQIELMVRRAIWEQHGGELVIGEAVVVATSHETIPKLIAAPTMRVPMRLGAESVSPYLATRAALRAALADPSIKAIALPGMGTGVGGVPAEISAVQTRQAIEDVVLGKFTMPTSWAEASERHQLLYGAEPRNLQHG
jgi:O-acetyl-ADP-ribose deacetylase (regulator of RNase III)